MAHPPVGPRAGPLLTGAGAGARRWRRQRRRGSGRARGGSGAGSGLLGLDARDLAAQRVAARLARGQRGALRAAGAREGRFTRGQQLVHAGQRPGAHLRLGGDLAHVALEGGEPLDGRVGGGLGRLGDRDDGLLLVLGAAQEVELLEQVVEPLGVEDHRDHVGRRGLVLGHELGLEDALGLGQRLAQQREVGALTRDLSLQRGQPGSVSGERLADRRLAALDQRDLRLQGADARVELADAGRQVALVGLLGTELSGARRGSGWRPSAGARAAQGPPTP